MILLGITYIYCPSLRYGFDITFIVQGTVSGQSAESGRIHGDFLSVQSLLAASTKGKTTGR